MKDKLFVGEFSVEELMKWKEKGFGHVNLVIVKTQTCPKCIKFLNHFDKFFDENFGFENVAIFTQKNTLEYENSRKLFVELGITSVPVVLYKYKGNISIKMTNDLPSFDSWMKWFLNNRVNQGENV